MKGTEFLYSIMCEGIQTAVRLTACYSDYSNCYSQAKCHQITDDLYLSELDLSNRDSFPYVIKEDIELLKLGLFLVSKEISEVSPHDKTLVIVEELIYLLVDYVPESIPAAIIGWAKEAFDFSIDKKSHILYYIKWLYDFEDGDKLVVNHRLMDIPSN